MRPSKQSVTVTQPGHTLRRIAWFVAIWCSSVAVLALVAWVIRVALRQAT
jgi:hypothetical protein